MKIEIKEVGSVIPYEMKAGIVTKIKVGDSIYVLEGKGESSERPVLKRIIKKTPVIRKPYKKKQGTVRPEGSLFSETYNAVIKKDEIDAVRQAIVKVELGYIPTAKNIVLTTGYKQMRLNAILDAMRKNNIITRSYNDDGKVIYKLIL